mmetsp:Transcript_24532/g.69967  ORF Transcript_24532/g.69967 Transcript_24532/m.69967 type:complete len:245 (+) Transcript_24532:160-894(+)
MQARVEVERGGPGALLLGRAPRQPRPVPEGDRGVQQVLEHLQGVLGWPGRRAGLPLHRRGLPAVGWRPRGGGFVDGRRVVATQGEGRRSARRRPGRGRGPGGSRRRAAGRRQARVVAQGHPLPQQAPRELRCGRQVRRPPQHGPRLCAPGGEGGGHGQPPVRLALRPAVAQLGGPKLGHRQLELQHRHVRERPRQDAGPRGAVRRALRRAEADEEPGLRASKVGHHRQRGREQRREHQLLPAGH